MVAQVHSQSTREHVTCDAKHLCFWACDNTQPNVRYLQFPVLRDIDFHFLKVKEHNSFYNERERKHGHEYGYRHVYEYRHKHDSYNRWWGGVRGAKTPLDFLKIPFLLYFNVKIIKYLNKFQVMLPFIYFKEHLKYKFIKMVTLTDVHGVNFNKSYQKIFNTTFIKNIKIYQKN